MDHGWRLLGLKWIAQIADGDYDDVDEQAFYLIGDMSTLKTMSSG